MAESDEDKFIKVTEEHGDFTYLASQDTEPSKEAIDALNEIGFDLLGFREHVRDTREEIEESIARTTEIESKKEVEILASVDLVFVHVDGETEFVTAYVGKPELIERAWRCAYGLKRAKRPRESRITGTNNLNALTLAISQLKNTIEDLRRLLNIKIYESESFKSTGPSESALLDWELYFYDPKLNLDE